MRIDKTIHGQKFPFYCRHIPKSMKITVEDFRTSEFMECEITPDFKYILLPERSTVYITDIGYVKVEKLKLSKRQQIDIKDSLGLLDVNKVKETVIKPVEFIKGRLVPRYSLISTLFPTNDGGFKSFGVIMDNLTEKDVLTIKFYFDKYIEMNNEVLNQELENAKNGKYTDLRKQLYIDLQKNVTDSFSDEIKKNCVLTISDCRKIWSEKDLIVQTFNID